MEFSGLDRVPHSVRGAVRRYAARLIDHGGQSVRSLTLYGTVAGGEFDPALHTIANVIVMHEVDLDSLRRLAEEGYDFGRHRICAPMVLTPQFVQASLDSYPLELIEIQQQYLVIFGEDYFGPLHFQPAHVRLQCERELKVLALAMRQAVVTEGGSERSLHKAVLPSLLGLVRILRGLLWLKQKRRPLTPPAMVVEIEEIVGQRLPGVRRAVEAHGTDDWSTFAQLYHDVETLGRVSDGW
jgi:hypothetical protein